MPTASEPASVEEAAAALREAAAAGRRVSIEREGGDVVLSTARLDRILEHEAGDLTCVVEAGVRLSALQARLAEHGQLLALDPPGDPTIGACLAGSLSGPWRHRYGTMRDLVIGVTVVLADGTIASSGGKVVKNVAGYDLGKLFHGSRGTLGLVARVALRLHPRPERRRTLAVPVGGPDDAQRLAQAVLHSDLVPSAVDLLWGGGAPAILALRFEGTTRAVDDQLARAAAMLDGAEAGDPLWGQALARQGAAGGSISFPPGELGRRLASLGEAVVRVGDGVAYVPGPVESPLPEPVRRLEQRVRGQFDPQGVLVA
ncbi:MAG: FAD-binding oxidoreductase [Thermoleophilia bacterium]